MYCSHCGCAYEDGVKFCAKCGAPVDVPACDDAQPTQKPAAPPYNAPVQPVSAYASLDGRGLLAAFAAKPLFLVTTAAYTAAILLNITGALLNFRTLGVYYYDDSFIIANIIRVLISQVIPIVLCVGLWLFQTEARAYRKTGVFATGGLSTLRVGTVGGVIFGCVLCGLFVLLGIIVITGNSIYNFLWNDLFKVSLSEIDNRFNSTSFGIGLMFILLAVFALLLAVTYFRDMAKTIRACRYTISSNNKTPYVSRLVIVVCFIWAFGSLTALFPVDLLSAGGNSVIIISSLLGCLASAASLTANICMGVQLIQYKKACGC